MRWPTTRPARTVPRPPPMRAPARRRTGDSRELWGPRRQTRPPPPARPPARAAARGGGAPTAAPVLGAARGGGGGCPPQLAEAVAALQDLAVGLAPPGQAASHRDQLWQLQSGLPTVVRAERSG